MIDDIYCISDVLMVKRVSTGKQNSINPHYPTRMTLFIGISLITPCCFSSCLEDQPCVGLIHLADVLYCLLPRCVDWLAHRQRLGPCYDGFFTPVGEIGRASCRDRAQVAGGGGCRT